MPRPLVLHPDRLLPADPAVRSIARALYADVAGLPIISPHGHTDPAWFALNQPFADAADLLLTPDHYVFRMLYSGDRRRSSRPARRLAAAGGALAPVSRNAVAALA
jgi:glucuronate isomerase